MNALSSLGLILLLALLAGHVVQTFRLPEVTGYIIAGVVLGPSVFGWVSQDNLQTLEIIGEVALGLILFSIGSVFEYSRFARLGRRVIYLTLMESTLASSIVFFGILALGQGWQVAALFGAIAIETAPASTLMVLRELNAKGPLTETLLGIIAVNNIGAIVAYSLVASVIDLTASWSGLPELLPNLYSAAFPLVWQLLGSIALGYLVGILLAGWATHVSEGGELLILLAGSILLTVGVARLFELSPLIASLTVGATMANLSQRSRRLFDALAGTDPPFYAIFFVIAGADLDLSAIPAMGALGAVYVVGRLIGKFVGARVGAARLGLDAPVQEYLGYAMTTQAGLAIGLTFAVSRRYPDYGPVVGTVVLSAVAIYEMIGPVLARYAIIRAGEAYVEREESGSIWALE